MQIEAPRAPMAIGGAVVIALAGLATLASLPTPVLLVVLVFGGGVAGLSLTRAGSRGRLVVQSLLGLAGLALGLAALAVLGLSIVVAAQIAKGHDNGFGGLVIVVGIPMGIGLALAALSVTSLALGGRRRRTRAADGLTWREPPVFP